MSSDWAWMVALLPLDEITVNLNVAPGFPDPLIKHPLNLVSSEGYTVLSLKVSTDILRPQLLPHHINLKRGDILSLLSDLSHLGLVAASLSSRKNHVGDELGYE